jgi:hypothetical protein
MKRNKFSSVRKDKTEEDNMIEKSHMMANKDRWKRLKECVKDPKGLKEMNDKMLEMSSDQHQPILPEHEKQHQVDFYTKMLAKRDEYLGGGSNNTKKPRPGEYG